MGKRRKWRISSYFVTLYVFLMFCIYPLYYEDGYYNMATAKCTFFLSVSVIALGSILAAAVVDLIRTKKGRYTEVWRKEISITEKLLYSYIIILLLSFLFSDFKRDVLWGATDWYMGTIPLLLITFLSLFLIHIWQEEKWMTIAFLIVSAAVFLLGICNRFSFYPIAIEPQNAVFISTLGNINWLCGYLSVVSPIGIGLFVFAEDNKYKYRWQKWLLFLYVLITFMIGYCQGSSSVFLWNGTLFFVLFWILLKSIDGIKKWLLLIAAWGMSGQLVRILKIIFPERYNYSSSAFIDTNISLVIALIAIGLYIVIHFYWKENKEFSDSFRNGICRNLVTTFIIGILLWLILSVYHTNKGISFLEDSPLFLLNESWGNGRGVIFKVSFDIFQSMSPMQKLFGIGADGFGAYAYSVPEIKMYLQSYFGENILTNAHCEILTNLINIGIIGTTVYMGIFITFIVRCLKKGKEFFYAYISAICVICYFANNLISFAQVLNLPYLFLILGMGEAYLRRCEK